MLFPKSFNAAKSFAWILKVGHSSRLAAAHSLPIWVFMHQDRKHIEMKHGIIIVHHQDRLGDLFVVFSANILHRKLAAVVKDWRKVSARLVG